MIDFNKPYNSFLGAGVGDPKYSQGGVMYGNDGKPMGMAKETATSKPVANDDIVKAATVDLPDLEGMTRPQLVKYAKATFNVKIKGNTKSSKMIEKIKVLAGE